MWVALKERPGHPGHKSHRAALGVAPPEITSEGVVTWQEEKGSVQLSPVP